MQESLQWRNRGGGVKLVTREEREVERKIEIEKREMHNSKIKIGGRV